MQNQHMQSNRSEQANQGLLEYQRATILIIIAITG